MQTLEDRVKLLEKSRARHRVASIAALATCGFIVLASAMRTDPRHLSVDSIEATKFMVRTPEGEVTGVFEAQGDFAALEMMDTDGQARVHLGPSWSGPGTSFRIFDPTGKSWIRMSAKSEMLDLTMDTLNPDTVPADDEAPRDPHRSTLWLYCARNRSWLKMGPGGSLHNGMGVQVERGKSHGYMHLDSSRLIEIGGDESVPRRAWGGETYFLVTPDERRDLPEEKIQRQ